MKTRSKTLTSDTKRKLVEQVGIAVRKMGAQSVILSKTVADRFSINQTDLEVLDLIFLQGSASAGELGRVTGLSSGSVTSLIDRLERDGYVERCDDPGDRRRVLVRARTKAIGPISETYKGMQARMFELWSDFESDELEIVRNFLARSTELAAECCTDIVGDRMKSVVSVQSAAADTGKSPSRPRSQPKSKR